MLGDEMGDVTSFVDPKLWIYAENKLQKGFGHQLTFSEQVNWQSHAIPRPHLDHRISQPLCAVPYGPYMEAIHFGQIRTVSSIAGRQQKNNTTSPENFRF
ncbi:hypothetical protein CISG_08301 [Coccidioides immitis RMSCC 3703]|uniref:Uncharacterized protein n=1 Tax=Coccidioides immitis RMSCC 3703 TaxID=454286 RepID=A0A0J8R8W1_COCIT|nr:hypothetical protein CISG_08301 [Coccidioides immitis RMSCC 3703]